MRIRHLLTVIGPAVFAATLTAAASQSHAQSAVPSQLVGQWASQQNGAQTVIILQSNGRYTATAVSGGGAYRITSWGQWRLHGNYLRFYVRNYSPRYYLGRPVDFPGSWGVTLRSVGRDRFVTTTGEVYFRRFGISGRTRTR